jgi:hypothetical protein
MREMSHQSQEFSHDALPPDGFLQSFDNPNVDMSQEPHCYNAVEPFITEPPASAEVPVEPPAVQAEISAESNVASTETEKPSVAHPHYTYQIRGNTHPMDVAGVDTYIQSLKQARRDAAHFPNERPLDNKEWTDIQREHEGMVAVGDELGVDLRDRLPRRQDYHMFDSQEVFSQDTATRFSKEGTETGGTCNIETGVLWVRRDNPINNISGLVHETAHDISNGTIVVDVVSETVDENGNVHCRINPTLFAGCHNDSTFNANGASMITEVATEMITNRAMYHTGHNEITLSYAPLDAIADAMIHEAAEHYDMPPRELADLFMRGALTGDRAGIILLQEAIGEERIAKFEQATSSDTDTGEALARELNLPRAVKSIQDYRAGTMSIFNWNS